MSRSRAVACLAVLTVLLGSAGCGRIEKTLAFGATAAGIDRTVVLDPPSRAAKASCAGKLVNDDLLAPPASIPTLDDSSWLRGRPQPGFAVYLAWVNADRSRDEDLRRALVQDGLARGYAVEAGSWRSRVLKIAYGGKADIRLSVQPFCKGRLALRYVVGSVDATPAPLPEAATATSRTCPARVAPAGVSGEQQLLPFPPDAQAMEVGAVADASVYSALVRADPATDPAQVGEALVSRLSTAGYVVAAPPALPAQRSRWQAALVGRHTGAVTVQPWCKGQLVVRYDLTPYVDPEGQAGRSKRPCAGRETAEATADPLPSWLSYAGQRVVSERTATSFRAWTAWRPGDTATGVGAGPGALVPILSASRQALGGVVPLLTTGGTRVLPVAGPTDVAATGLAGAEGTALLVIRPVCLGTLAETYVVLR